MGDPRYQRCKGCGKLSGEVGTLSWTRQCVECGRKKLYANTLGISNHTGPEFQRWRRACVASFGGVLLDDIAASTHTDGHG